MTSFNKVHNGTRVSLALIAALAFGPLSALAQSTTGYFGPGRYEIEVVASGKAVEVDLRDGRTVRQWTAVHQGDQPNPPNNLRNQQWDIEDAGGGYVRIKSAETGNALDAEHFNAHEGVPVVLSRPEKEDEQLWRIENAGEGEAKIVSRLGKALDLPDGSHSNGTRLQVFPSNSGDNQKFRFFRVGGRGLRDSSYRIPDRPERFERGGYDLGYSLGLEDSRAQLRRTYARHKGQYNPEWEEAFIEGYYDGYDNGNGRERGERIRDMDRDPYDSGYRLGRQDSLESRRPDYRRYQDRFDARSEPYFRRGYADGYYAAP
jgi:hypothetical protein